ncbi:MAG: PD-(D/E)XK nuclease family protein [Elusimicrobiota bacterium]|nr:PD-(D/E)XK nuclease family protein [Endomicrobiia bacterium]MDW8165456.1 PD-(D/E)XK nuclease family protein [Elusimicrobiota bacterium]
MNIDRELEYYVFSFSDNLLEKIAEYILTNFDISELNQVCIIFGGKRPGLILKKLISEKIKKSFLPPHTFSIDEFIVYTASKKEEINFIYELDAIYLLYKIIKKIPYLQSKFDTFFNFIPWGYEILNFLEEMLLEDISDEKLLNFQKEAEIGFSVPDTINKLLQNIVKIKENFYNTLKNNKIFTRAMLYQFVSSTKNYDLDEFKKIIFVSPFYLHFTEYNFIKNLLNTKKVVIFFQGSQDKWPQLENLSKKFGIKIKVEEEHKFSNIYFYSNIDSQQEMLCAYNIIKNLSKSELEKAVIVLPDDNTATSFINYIPPNVEEFNFVCGYPIKRSSIYSLLESIFNAQLTKKGSKYYTKSYIEVINNKLIKSLNLFDNSELTPLLIDIIQSIILGKFEDENVSNSSFLNIKDIENSKTLYEKLYEIINTKNIIIKVPFEEIKNFIKKLHCFLFYQWEEVDCFKSFCEKLEILLDNILKYTTATEYSFNLEIFKKIYEVLEIFKNTSFVEEKFSQEDIFKIFLNEVENKKLSFFGSPIKGLQILGFYETRNLNFERVIILDVNEGVLPYLRSQPSLIPSEVLLRIGIDRLSIEEEIQRYHFFRLIKSAKEVHLIYIESKDKEKSRFVEELLWEQQKNLNTLYIKDVYFTLYETEISFEKQKIQKTPQIIEHLQNITYSSTSIDVYLNCPIKFYFKYVLNLKEDEILEEPEGKKIGEFIHRFLESIFKKYEEKYPVIDDIFIENSLNFLKENFDKTLKRSYKTDSFLVEKVMSFILKEFLIYEKNRIQQHNVTKIVLLEKLFYKNFKFDNKNFKFLLKIDRIDELKDGSLLIIDYKTGELQMMNKKLEDFKNFSRENIKKKIKSFQLPLYIEAVKESFPDRKINAMFYDIKNLECKFLFDDKDQTTIYPIVLNALKYILEEIINPEIPFIPDETDTRYCNFCYFKYMCR